MPALQPSRSWTFLTIVALALVAGAAISLFRPVETPPEAYAAPETGAVDGGIAFFEDRLAIDPTNSVFASQLVARYLRRFRLTAELEDLERAEVLAREALDVDPDRATARSRMASVLLAQHRFADALKEAERAVGSDGADLGAWSVLFDAAFAAGRYNRARRALTRLDRGTVTRKVQQAFWLDALGRSESAYGSLDAACRRMATWSRPAIHGWCLVELAGIELSRNGPRAAATLYARALEVVPGYRAAVEGLADLAYARDDLVEAERLYRRITVDAHPDLYLRLAELRRLQGDETAALGYERAFLRVAERSDAGPLYARPLALYYAERGELDLALAVARRDADRRPTVESRDVLAWVRFRRGDLDAALAASNEAFGWGAPSPTMMYHRARILEAMGSSEKATGLMDEALETPALLAPHVRLEERPRRGP